VTPRGLRASRLLPIPAVLLAALGCALLRPAPLEVPPGHAAVVGRVEVSGFGMGDALLSIVREDGTFDYTLPVGQAPADFAIVLPQGRYRVVQLLAIRDLTGDQAIWPLRLGFETDADRAVYVGTLRLSGGFAVRLDVSVLDQYDATLRAVRRLYRDLPEPVVRHLMSAT
jgi:hypothetical protein